MAFVKLDVQILDSSIWCDRDARDVLITALLKSQPLEVTEPMAELHPRSLDKTGWDVPPGWYGFVPAAAVGLLHTAVVELEPGMQALERLASPEAGSRSQEYEGRRLVRVNGGYILLNYDKFHMKDHSAAKRMRRYRQRLKDERYGVTERNGGVTSRNVTHLDVDVDVDVDQQGKVHETSTPEEIPSVHGVGSGEGEDRGERKRPYVEATSRYVDVFNAVTGRKVKPNSEVRKKYARARKAGYRDEELWVLPVVHAALNSHRREARQLEPDWLLRDGSTGTHNWIGEALRMVDQTKISGVLAQQANALGLSGVLRELGAKVEEEDRYA